MSIESSSPKSPRQGGGSLERKQWSGSLRATKENSLCRDWEVGQDTQGPGNPRRVVAGVVQAVHEGLGHAGTLAMWKELEKQHIWIPESQVRRVLEECRVRGQYNAGRRGQRVGGLTVKSTIPWGSVCMDVAGPMGVTGKKGEKESDHKKKVIIESTSTCWCLWILCQGT